SAPASLDEFCRSLPVAFAKLDRQRRVRWANARFAAFARTPLAQCSGQSLDALLPRLAPQLRSLSRRALQSDTPVTQLLLDQTSKGAIATTGTGGWSITLAAVRAKSGRVTGCNCFAQEVVGNSVAAEELRERLMFETFLSDLSAQFINVPTAS